MPSAESLRLVSCSICSAGPELNRVGHGDRLWLWLWLLVAAAASMIISVDAAPEAIRSNRGRLWLLVVAASMTISPDAGLELIRGNGGRLWLLVATASMIISFDARLLCVPHLVISNQYG